MDERANNLKEVRPEVQEMMEALIKMEGNFNKDKEGVIVMYGNGEEGKLLAALMGDPQSLHNTLLNTMFKDKLAAQLVVNCANEYVRLKLFECNDDGCDCESCQRQRKDLNGLQEGEGEAVQMTNYIETNPKNIN